MEQRSETYETYVTDSLFYLQNLFIGGEEEKQIFSLRFSEILNESKVHAEEPDPDPDEIIRKMREKARSMK